MCLQVLSFISSGVPLKKLSGAHLRTSNMHSNTVKLNVSAWAEFSDRITAHGIVSKWREFLRLDSQFLRIK